MPVVVARVVHMGWARVGGIVALVALGWATPAAACSGESDCAAGELSRFSWRADSGNERYGLYCGSCGTRIVNGQNPTIGFYSLREETLDDTSWLRPAGHTWTHSAQPWFKPDPEDLLYEQQAADYTALIERFATLQSFE